MRYRLRFVSSIDGTHITHPATGTRDEMLPVLLRVRFTRRTAWLEPIKAA